MEQESGVRPPRRGNAGGLQYDCVLLSGPTSPLPQRLIDGLRARGARVRVAADAPSVMVNLAATAGGEHPLPRVLIVNEPAAHRSLASLLASVRRYYPQARCWRYEAGLPARVGLRPFDEQAPAPGPSREELRAQAPSLGTFRGARHPEAAAAPVANDRSKVEPTTAPQPRPAAESPAPPRRPRPTVALDAPLVSKEELAMLLGFAESRAEPSSPPGHDAGATPRRTSRGD